MISPSSVPCSMFSRFSARFRVYVDRRKLNKKGRLERARRPAGGVKSEQRTCECMHDHGRVKLMRESRSQQRTPKRGAQGAMRSKKGSMRPPDLGSQHNDPKGAEWGQKPSQIRAHIGQISGFQAHASRASLRKQQSLHARVRGLEQRATSF